MGILFTDHLLSRQRMAFDGELVSHGAAGDEKRRLFAEQRGHPLLQGVDCGVFAEYVVAHLRFHHGPAHGPGGLGHCITAEIDEGVSHVFVLSLPAGPDQMP